MDFHSLSRRELQSLCKKNKIPANLTNLAMADSLKSLQFVEGIEEFFNPSESVTAQSSIESPEKSEVTSSPCVPRTGGRTTSRRTVKDEVENSQVSTRVMRSNRKLVVGEFGDDKPNKGIETPAVTNTRRAQGASVRRKMDRQLKEVEEDKEIEKEGISETPKVVPGSQRRGPSTVKLVYSTRRSTRLAEKNKDNTNLKKNEKLESFNGELFAEESGENLEISDVKVGECSDDLGEIIESSDIDLKEKLDEGVEGNNDKGDNSDEKSGCVIEKGIQLESELDEESSENFEVFKSEMSIEEDVVEGHECDVEDKAADGSKEVYGEKCEETDPSADIFNKPLEMVDEIKENSECAELYLTEKEDVVENVEDKLNANEEEEEVLEDGNNENDIGFKDGSADDLGEANKYFVDLAAFDKYNEGLENESGKSLAVESLLIHSKDEEERGMDLVSALETMTLEKTYDSLTEESIPDNAKEETAAVELNASVESQPNEESANSCDVLDLPLGPSCLTQSKKSASKKTPTTIKMLSHVFDDKENIDNSGTKPILTKEKKTKDFGQSQFVDLSLRQLKKVVKEKTEMIKKKDEQVMSSRPALQAVSENIVAE